jgi:hypothetical protein
MWFIRECGLSKGPERPLPGVHQGKVIAEPQSLLSELFAQHRIDARHRSGVQTALRRGGPLKKMLSFRAKRVTFTRCPN